MDSDQININEKLQEDTYSDEAQTRIQFNVEEDEGNKPLTILEEP